MDESLKDTVEHSHLGLIEGGPVIQQNAASVAAVWINAPV
jgi:hypothetical protein